MRYASTQKDITRDRITSVAAELFKVNGTDATGVTAIMKQAGLTNGAFYAHFASKEALVGAVIATQLAAQLERFKQELGGVAGLKRIIDIYLSDEHVNNCADGCPSAALLGEVSKRAISTRRAYTKGLWAITDEFSASGPFADDEQKRAVLALFGLLVGTLQLARTVTDDVFAQDIIKGGRTAAYNLLATSFTE